MLSQLAAPETASVHDERQCSHTQTKQRRVLDVAEVVNTNRGNGNRKSLSTFSTDPHPTSLPTSGDTAAQRLGCIFLVAILHGETPSSHK